MKDGCQEDVLNEGTREGRQRSENDTRTGRWIHITVSVYEEVRRRHGGGSVMVSVLLETFDKLMNYQSLIHQPGTSGNSSLFQHDKDPNTQSVHQSTRG